jgi:hypothetical protein
LDLTKIATRVSMLDENIVVLGPTKRLQPLPKGDDAGQDFWIVLSIRMQERDATHPLALLTRREGLCGYHTGDQRDEVAPRWLI